ncbi:MAG: FecR domain-containing protein [Maribacter sp.]
MQDNYLAKWLNDELTEAELAEFKKSDAYATYQKIKDAASTMEAPEFDMDKALASLTLSKKNVEPKVFTMAPFKTFLRIAAVVAVLFAASFIYLSTLDETISTAYAESKSITLPDNSEIVLNAESEVSYSEKNWETHRNIDLRGEAYFKVAKGQQFTVATKQGVVTVLGTQFNVEARNNYLEVSCFEGLVSVTFNGAETKLPAGNSFLAINGKSSAQKVDINGSPSWLTNESSFKSVPLHYVLDELQRQYDLHVETEDIDLNQAYTGSFSNEHLNLALKSISVPLQIKFKLEGNKVLFYDEKAP